MSDTRYAEAMRRVLTATGDALSEVNEEVPFPRWPLRKRILWRFTGVPSEVRAEELRIGRARADLLFDAMARARDTLAGSTDE